LAEGKEIKIIKVAGKSYAVGLFWQPIQDEKQYMREIRDTIAGVLPGANLYCLVKGASPQYGLGFTSQKQRVGMPSGAAGILSALRDKSSAVCAFRVDEGWWFVTIRNNLILTEEDTVYPYEEDAKEAFLSMLAIPDWGYKIAPAAWGIEDTKEVSAEDLLLKGKSSELKRVRAETNPKVMVSLLVVALGAWWLYSSDSSEERKLEFERQRLAAIAAAAAEEEEDENAQAIAPPPWENLIDAEDFAKKCTILVVNSTAVIPGWNLSNSSCSEREMVATYQRTYGTAEWIMGDAQRFNVLPPQMNLRAADSAFNSVIGTISIPMVRRRSEEPNMRKTEIQREVSAIFQSLRIDNFRFEDRVETIGSEQADLRRNYPFTGFSFADVSWRLPLDWVNLFSGIKSVEITSIKWDNTTRKWSYEGRIYEKE